MAGQGCPRPPSSSYKIERRKSALSDCSTSLDSQPLYLTDESCSVSLSNLTMLLQWSELPRVCNVSAMRSILCCHDLTKDCLRTLCYYRMIVLLLLPGCRLSCIAKAIPQRFHLAMLIIGGKKCLIAAEEGATIVSFQTCTVIWLRPGCRLSNLSSS